MENTRYRRFRSSVQSDHLSLSLGLSWVIAIVTQDNQFLHSIHGVSVIHSLTPPYTAMACEPVSPTAPPRYYCYLITCSAQVLLQGITAIWSPAQLRYYSQVLLQYDHLLCSGITPMYYCYLITCSAQILLLGITAIWSPALLRYYSQVLLLSGHLISSGITPRYYCYMITCYAQ